MDWSGIRFLGNNKIVQQNYFWIFALPIVIKLSELGYLERALVDSKLATELPFSWYFFYFAALFFAMGTSIYLVRCPELVKKYSDYSEYKKTGANFVQLNSHVQRVCKLSKKNLNSFTDILESHQTATGTDDIDNFKTTCIEVNNQSSFNLNNRFENEVFWELYDLAKNSNRISLVISLVFYALGFILLIYIFFDNLLLVLRNMFCT